MLSAGLTGGVQWCPTQIRWRHFAGISREIHPREDTERSRASRRPARDDCAQMRTIAAHGGSMLLQQVPAGGYHGIPAMPREEHDLRGMTPSVAVRIILGNARRGYQVWRSTCRHEVTDTHCTQLRDAFYIPGIITLVCESVGFRLESLKQRSCATTMKKKGGIDRDVSPLTPGPRGVNDVTGSMVQ